MDSKMPRVKVPPVQDKLKEILNNKGIEVVQDITVEEMEKELIDYLNNHNVLHLSTCRDNNPRSTILEYCSNGLEVYIFSEGGGKIGNILKNENVSYTIADPFHPVELGLLGYLQSLLEALMGQIVILYLEQHHALQEPEIRIILPR